MGLLGLTDLEIAPTSSTIAQTKYPYTPKIKMGSLYNL